MLRNPDIQRLLANLRGSAVNIDNQVVDPVAVADQNSLHKTSDSLGAQNRATSIIQQADAASHEVNLNKLATPVQLDASTIITWPAAIKYVSKHVVANEILEAKIKRLIADQHKHEREWWTKREAIINRHNGRAGNQQKAAELLRSLGGQYVPVAPTDPDIDVAELEAYDIKVHKSLTQMAAHYDRELRLIGIPFFAIKHELVVLEKGKEEAGVSKGRLDRGELRQLQSRMLVYLEELFGEES